MKGIKTIKPSTDVKESTGTEIANNIAKMGSKKGKSTLKLDYKLGTKKLNIKI
jgi:hypothetical protein